MLDKCSGPSHNGYANLGIVEVPAVPAVPAETRQSLVVNPSPKIRLMSDEVRLIDSQGKFIRLICASEAHALIRERKASGVGTKTKIREVRLTVARKQLEDKGIPCRPLLPSGLVGQRYSHKHDTQDNPENVWTLKRLSSPDAKTDLFVHLAHIDSVLACLNPRERDAMIHGLGSMRGLRAKDLKSFISSSASTVRP